jgi:hypothetical protein
MRRTFIRSGLIAALFLGASVPVAFTLMFVAAENLPRHGGWATVAGFGFLLGGLFLGGALWGRSVAGAVGAQQPLRLSVLTGLTFSLATLSAAAVLGKLEVVFVEEQRAGAIPVHLVFAVLFTAAAFVVAAVVALVIGRSVGGWRPALNLAWWTGLASAGAFLLADIVQDLLGRRVGGPNAEATATMITVMLIGNLLAAFTGGGVMVTRLAPAPRSRADFEAATVRA